MTDFYYATKQLIAKYFPTKYKLLTILRRSYADILAQTMSAAPLPPQPEQQSPLPPYQRQTLLPSPRSLLRSLHWRCSRMAAIMTGHHNCLCKEQTATSSVFIFYWGRYHMYDTVGGVCRRRHRPVARPRLAPLAQRPARRLRLRAHCPCANGPVLDGRVFRDRARSSARRSVWTASVGPHPTSLLVDELNMQNNRNKLVF